MKIDEEILVSEREPSQVDYDERGHVEAWNVDEGVWEKRYFFDFASHHLWTEEQRIEIRRKWPKWRRVESSIGQKSNREVTERKDPLRGLPPRLAEKWKLVISGEDRAVEDKDDYDIYCIQDAYDKINKKSLPSFTLNPVKEEKPRDIFEIRLVYEHGNAVLYTHETIGIPNREGCWTVNDILLVLNAPEAKLPVTHGRYEWWAESNVEYFRVPLDLTNLGDTYAKLYSYDIYYRDSEGHMFKVNLDQKNKEV